MSVNNRSIQKIIIADDHPLFRSALAQALKSTMPDAQFFEVANVAELEIVLNGNADADLLLMDLHMPDANGFVGLSHVVKNYPQLPVVMISANEELNVARQAQHYGALGFIPKSASIPEMARAIELVLDGEIYFPANIDTSELIVEPEQEELIQKIAEFTPKQLEVFNLLADGLLNKQIAYEQKVTEATVKAHVTAIMRKLGVNNRTQIVLMASKVKVDENFGVDRPGE
ncbi:response regulator transcription factor [Aliikangiella coralliicola]|uniref:response regulator transcription factor n=1 Tax=Aliikangiella coralliicola TaxID=2592383 RepID=UPI001FEB405A|nr:response regulator transcription factor [Aliikangiella coralliicola]